MYLRKTILLLLCYLLLACGSPEERVEAYMKNAHALYDAGDSTEANLEVSNALQIDPKHVAARLLAATIAMENGSIRGAYKHLIAAVESDPSNLDAQLMLGKLYFIGQDIDHTNEQASIVMAMAPGDARSRMTNAYAKHLNGDHDAALEATNMAIEIDPEWINPYLFRASVYANKGDLDTAINILDAITIDNLNAGDIQRLRKFRILLLKRAGRTDDAEVEMIALAQDFPESEEYLNSLLDLYIEQNRSDDAEDTIRKITQQGPRGHKPLDHACAVPIRTT